MKNRPHMKKMNNNEKNFKLRVFFGLVPRPKGRFRDQAPYTDVIVSLGLRGAQKWPKKAKNAIK